jgi:hypothetical protein
MWRIDGVEHARIHDPVAALSLAGQPPLTRLFANGEVVVRDGDLARTDQAEIARNAAAASRALLS